MEGRRQERGIEKEHETVTTSIPRNAFNSTFSSPFVDGNMVAMFKYQGGRYNEPIFQLELERKWKVERNNFVAIVK